MKFFRLPHAADGSLRAHLFHRTHAAPVVDPPSEPTHPDDPTVNLVMDLALRIGELQLASGAGASEVTATLLAVMEELGLPRAEVDVIFTSITATCHRGPWLAPVTAMRVVRSRRLDYTRLTQTEGLVRKILAGRLSARAAHAEMEAISLAPHPYPRWLPTVAWGGLAAFVTLILGGGFDIALAAFGITAIVDRLGRLLNNVALPFFFQQVVGGVVATLSAMAVVSINLFTTDKPTLVAAASLTVLLSGLSLVGAVQDAITGYSVTAAGRTIEIMLMSAGLITGVVVALKIAVSLGFERTPLPEVIDATPQRLPLLVAACIGASACFALASYSTVRAMAVAAVAGGLGGAVYGSLKLFDVGSITASAAAATLVGLGGGVLARRLNVTPLVVAVSGITPLLPGLATYRGLYELGVEPGGSTDSLITALGIGLALASGVVLGQFLSQPVKSGLGRVERRLDLIERRLTVPTRRRRPPQ